MSRCSLEITATHVDLPAGGGNIYPPRQRNKQFSTCRYHDNGYIGCRADTLGVGGSKISLVERTLTAGILEDWAARRIWLHRELVHPIVRHERDLEPTERIREQQLSWQ